MTLNRPGLSYLINSSKMLIAENLVKSGAVSGDKFNEKLTELIKNSSITKVIETGTLYGTGTTRAILNGLSGEFDFFSIECNPANFKTAKKNLGSVKGLHLINGLTVGWDDLPISLSDGLPDHVIIDHQPENRWNLYFKETDFDVPEHELDKALKFFDYCPELVVLDSAGYMGMVEFKYLMERVKQPFYLALDDTGHYKHYQTMEFIRSMPSRFVIQWEVPSINVDKEKGEKFGSAIIFVS